jgi:hypothetical protein
VAPGLTGYGVDRLLNHLQSGNTHIRAKQSIHKSGSNTYPFHIASETFGGGWTARIFAGFRDDPDACLN